MIDIFIGIILKMYYACVIHIKCFWKTKLCLCIGNIKLFVLNINIRKIYKLELDLSLNTLN